jgi:hypothetical protein
MPVTRKDHQTQFPATPPCRTMSVTRFGVSLLKVVATIDSPASHHGTDRPEAKNSDVLLLDRRAKNRAGRKQTAIVAAMTAQSIG